MRAPDPLDPHQNDRSAPRRQVPHPTRPPIMQLSHRPALGATHQIDGGLNRLLQLTVDLRHGQHDKPGQTPTSPPQHYALVPPGASISVSLNTTDHQAPDPSPGSG